jgi:glutathione synthase/RimK-type ligase-like ATP-grasp enzyme
VLYEHPAWFEKLFAELDRRGVAYRKLPATEHFFDPASPQEGLSVVFNRMSPSADRREHGSGIFYTQSYLSHLELHGIRVVNGATAFRFETSKALQLSLLRSLGLPHPASRVIHDPRHAPEASQGLRFPIVVKPNVGGSGAGVVRYNSREELESAVRDGQVHLGFDHVGLVQEFIPARDGHITRVETLAGQYLYAIQVHLSGETFDLCPADICQTTRGESLNNACVVEAAKAGLKVEGYRPPPPVIALVEKIAQAASIDVGGIEYIIDDRDGQLYFYDINALSNFVADAPRVVGFDPFVKLADFLIQEMAQELAHAQ